MEKAREATTHIQKVETERDHKIRSLYADLEPEDRIADVMDERLEEYQEKMAVNIE